MGVQWACHVVSHDVWRLHRPREMMRSCKIGGKNRLDGEDNLLRVRSRRRGARLGKRRRCWRLRVRDREALWGMGWGVAVVVEMVWGWGLVVVLEVEVVVGFLGRGHRREVGRLLGR